MQQSRRASLRWLSKRCLAYAAASLLGLCLFLAALFPVPEIGVSRRASFTCSSKQIEDQRASFVELTAPGWYSACEGHTTLKAIHLASPGRCGKVFIDVGANKGFLVAEWLSFWAPELGITQSELGNYWKGLNIPHPCGPCNDCAGSSPGTDATYAGSGGACPLGGPTDLRVFGLEGSPTTHSALNAAPVWARAPAGTVSLLNLAGDVRPGLVNFSVCDVGSELCKITGGASVAVPSVSVDHFLAERGIASVFVLAVDTEGHDPIVLKGAEGSLRAGAIELVMFENGWLDHPTPKTVKWLESFGYACFLEGPRHLFLYTRCWSEPLETWNRWSNTVCVQTESPLFDVFLKRTILL